MVYLVLRAVYVPIIHDEIATFFRFIHLGQVHPWMSEWSANNHYLNSLLSLGFYRVFGSGQFVLKLANLIFFPVYFFFVYKISFQLKSLWLGWGLFIILLFSHNFFEFFSLCRGYGMSMALLAGSIWFGMQALRSSKPKHIVLSLLFIALGAYANLNLVNTLIIFIGIYSLKMLLEIKSDTPALAFRKAGIILFSGIIPLIFFIKILFQLKDEGELYYGKAVSSLGHSLQTLVHLLSGSNAYLIYILAIILIAVTLVVYLIQWGQRLGKGQHLDLLNHKQLFILLFIGNIFAVLIEHLLFDTNYPEDRTGLYFFIIITGSLFYGLDQLKIKNQLLVLIPVLPLLFFPIHFITHMNLSWSSMENEAIPLRFYETIAASQKNDRYPPSVEAYQSRVMRWNYVNYQEKQEQQCIQFEGYPWYLGDFIIASKNDDLNWETRYDSIDGDRQTGLFLLQRKARLSKSLLKSISDRPHLEVSNTYTDLYRGKIDTLTGKSLGLGFTLNISSASKPLHAWLVTSVSNTERETLRYEFTPLDWYRNHWPENGKAFTNAQIITKLPEGASEYVSYIWNIDQVEYTLHNFSLEIFELSDPEKENKRSE